MSELYISIRALSIREAPPSEVYVGLERGTKRFQQGSSQQRDLRTERVKQLPIGIPAQSYKVTKIFQELTAERAQRMKAK
jgi:hypothetical protein